MQKASVFEAKPPKIRVPLGASSLPDDVIYRKTH
jgi:hypothetical protein